MTHDPAPLAILGLGHGGSRVAASVHEAFDEEGFRIAAADTDQRALGSLGLPSAIVLGAEWAKGQGCGGDVKRGERAAAGCRKLLEDAFGSALTIVVAGLGGGAGGGTAVVVARLARELGRPTVFLVTLPIAMEGRARRMQAEETLRELRETADTVVAVSNDHLFSALPPDTPAPLAFATANRVLAETVAVWGRLFLAQPLLPIDLAAIRSLIGTESTHCQIGVVCGSPEATPDELVEELERCPFLGGAEGMAQAESALVGVVGGPNLSMGRLHALMERLDACFSPNARLAKGGGTLPTVRSGPQIMVLTCRREQGPGGPRQLDLFADNPLVSHGKRGKHAGVGGGLLRQESFDLTEPSLGIFAGSDPTKVGAENLDIPTFQRRGIRIDLGE